jgi:DNA-binding XRE family transcriptional regulator
VSEIGTQTQPPTDRRRRAGYNGGKALPVIRTLRELRVDAGITMSALERASGVNRAIISQIERGG